MKNKSLEKRFNTTEEELTRLGSEFNSEALPLIDKLYNTSFWILLDKKTTKKVINQTYLEAIEYCDKTKAGADWWGWIHRIWMREIRDFYTPKENDIQTIFDFIDFAEVDLAEVKTVFNTDRFDSLTSEKELINSLNKIPSVLRIPLILKELHNLDYEKIAQLIDVPDGVVATRLYRARKLLFLFLKGNFNYEEQKRIGLPDNFSPVIFEKRKCALLVDIEISEKLSSEFKKTITTENEHKTEILVQEEIKKLLRKLSFDSSAVESIKAKIERKAYKKFGKY
jgi:DNA-directed RNA polymerase specialized sigma24 family protein